MQLSSARSRSSCLLNAQVAVGTSSGLATASFRSAPNVTLSKWALLCSRPTIKLLDGWPIGPDPKQSIASLTASDGKDAATTPEPAAETTSISVPGVIDSRLPGPNGRRCQSGTSPPRKLIFPTALGRSEPRLVRIAQRI